MKTTCRESSKPHLIPAASKRSFSAVAIQKSILEPSSSQCTNHLFFHNEDIMSEEWQVVRTLLPSSICSANVKSECAILVIGPYTPVSWRVLLFQNIIFYVQSVSLDCFLFMKLFWAVSSFIDQNRVADARYHSIADEVSSKQNQFIPRS